jgi:cellulose synthase/poly-beta-1,6-N-acetylglucosamine synthase-like glycosyltransferase
MDGFLLSFAVLHGLNRNFDDSDRGVGNQVAMTPPLRPSYKRCAAFTSVSFAVSVALVCLRSPAPTDIYHRLVGFLLGSVIHDPAAVAVYAKAVPPVFQLNFIAFGIAFAVAFRASLARRLVILMNIALGLGVSAVVDAFFGLFVLETRFPVGPTPVLNVLLQYCVAGVVALRISFTSFQLPRKTPVPLRRGNDLGADAVLAVAVVFGIAVTAAFANYAVAWFGSSPTVIALVVFACPTYMFISTNLALLAIRTARRRRVSPGSHTPPIEVIIPAYNEEVVIARLLQSLDAAAARYGGPVRVILCDDGSNDDTVLIAQETMAAYTHARGEIITGRHGGKSAALNLALAECTADYIFRLDADCEAHPDCFRYAMPNFLADPQIGLVGGFTMPKEPYTTWIDRMRLFEVSVLFGFTRPASDVVDGIYCVPGFFTGFRREAALEIGGFIDGMYGEDVEFTYSISRLGYRAVIDTRAITYEDVPNTQRQLRIQRTRWNRGGTMSFARNVPVVTGLAGPRSWFFATRAGMSRAMNPMKLSLLTFILAQALFAPSAHSNLPRLLVATTLRLTPAVLLVVVFTAWRGKARELAWLPVFYGYVLLRHLYSLEAYLSFNPRPVVTPRLAEALKPSRPDPVGAVVGRS